MQFTKLPAATSPLCPGLVSVFSAENHSSPEALKIHKDHSGSNISVDSTCREGTLRKLIFPKATLMLDDLQVQETSPHACSVPVDVKLEVSAEHPTSGKLSRQNHI